MHVHVGPKVVLIWGAGMADSEAVPVATEDAPKLVGEALQAAVAQEPPKPPAPPAVEGVAEPAVEGATQAGANTPPN